MHLATKNMKNRSKPVSRATNIKIQLSKWNMAQQLYSLPITKI